MAQGKQGFSSIDELSRFLANRAHRSIVVSFAPCLDYPGMVRAVELTTSDFGKQIRLLVDYSCYGLDAGAPETGMSYTFAAKFDNLPALLQFVELAYRIGLQDLTPQGPSAINLPAPSDPPEAIARYEAGWRRFEADSKSAALPEHAFPEFG